MQRLRNKDSTEIDKLRQALRACKLHLFDQFVFCLQTLRVGTLNQVLADNSDISLATVTRIFLSWINFLYLLLGSMSIWPSRAKIDNPCQTVLKSFIPNAGES